MDGIKQFIRFAIVGVAVALTYIGLYLTLVSAGMAQFIANGMAFSQAVVLQYACQSAFTFHKPLADKTQIVRFAAMISLGYVTSALITGPVAVWMAFPAWKAAIAVTVILPVQNYVLMTLWVFATPSSPKSDVTS